MRLLLLITAALVLNASAQEKPPNSDQKKPKEETAQKWEIKVLLQVDEAVASPDFKKEKANAFHLKESAFLTSYSKAGWELVSVFPESVTIAGKQTRAYKYYFKRKIK